MVISKMKKWRILFTKARLLFCRRRNRRRVWQLNWSWPSSSKRPSQRWLGGIKPKLRLRTKRRGSPRSFRGCVTARHAVCRRGGEQFQRSDVLLSCACVSARYEVQVSSQQQKTLFDSPSCLRTSWRWSTWSGPSWWLSVNSWSCSPSAPTTCSGFSWWWNWEPSSQTMRWDEGLTETTCYTPFFSSRLHCL